MSQFTEIIAQLEHNEQVSRLFRDSLEPDYEAHDPQQKKPTRHCPLCGGEIYEKHKRICDDCFADEQLARMDVYDEED